MNLRQSRFVKGEISQVELSKKSKVFQSRISGHERGFLQLRKDEKRRIEKTLDMKNMIEWQPKQSNMREENS